MARASIRFKILILVAVPLVFELIVALGLYVLVQAGEQQAERVRRSSQICHLIGKFVSDFIGECHSLGSEFDAPLLRHSGFTSEAQEYYKLLRTLFEGDKSRLGALETARAQVLAVQALAAEARISSELRDIARFKQIKAEAEELARLMANSEIIAIGKIEKEVGTTAPMISEQFNRLIALFLMANVIATFALALMTVWIFNYSFCRRLQFVKMNAERFASNEPLLPPLSGRDEIAQLESCFLATTEVINEARKRERGIVQHVRDFMFSLSGEHVFLTVNPAAKTILGYDPEELVGLAFEELVDCSVAARASGEIEDIKLQMKSTFETRLTRSNGQIIDVMFSGRYAESTQRIFGIVRDISPAKQLERTQQEIVAMVSHDLRTPLTTVRHIHEMCLDGLIPNDKSDLRARVVSCEHAAQRMLWLISNLLSLEKHRAGMLETSPVIVEISSLIEDCKETLSPFASMRSISISNECGMVSVAGGEEQLKQLLLNSMLLFVDYGAAGGQIKLSSTVVSQLVTIAIAADNRFPQQLVSWVEAQSGDSKQPFGAAGLSLAAAGMLSELNGGSLHLENDDKQNSACLRIVLPIVSHSGSA